MWKRGRKEPRGPSGSSSDELISLAAIRKGAEVLVSASESSNNPLNWSPPSVRSLAVLISEFSAEDFVAAFPHVAGYFGELIVRNGGGQWIEDPNGFPRVRTSTGFELSPDSAVADSRDAFGTQLESVYVHAMSGYPVPDDYLATVFGDDVGQRMRVFATIFLHEVAISGRTLDWSLESLTEVDALCSEFLADDPDPEALDETALVMGAYLGEVIVRASGHAQWSYNSEYGDLAIEVARTGVEQDETITCFPLVFVANRLSLETTQALHDYATMAVSGEISG